MQFFIKKLAKVVETVEKVIEKEPVYCSGNHN
jgi:hypothetical protein